MKNLGKHLGKSIWSDEEIMMIEISGSLFSPESNTSGGNE